MAENTGSNRESLSWLVPAVASAVVSLVVAMTASAITLQQVSKENLREVAKIKLEIIKYAKESEVSSVLAALWVLEGVVDEKQLEAFTDQVKNIITKKVESNPDSGGADHISSEEILKIAPPANGSLQELIKKFESDERLAASNALLERYSENPAEVIRALISALDGTSRAQYRTSLYVPFTLKRIEGGWEGTVEQRNRIASIAGTSADSTIQRRVKQAIDNWRQSKS